MAVAAALVSKLVSLHNLHCGFHDVPSGLLLAAAAALSSKLVSLHDFSSGLLSAAAATLSPIRLSPTCLPLDSRCSDFTFVAYLSPLVSRLSPTRLWMLCPHDLIHIITCLGLSPTCLRLGSGCSACMILQILVSACLWMLCPYDYKFVSLSSPTILSVRMSAGLSPTCLPMHSGCSECFGPMISHLFPGSCLPLSECFGPHDFALVPHLSTCLPAVPRYNVDSAGMISGLSSTCPVSRYTLGSLRAYFQACLPLVSQCTLDALSALVP